MKPFALGIICACGLAAAACAGSTAPTSPTPSFLTAPGGGTAVATPMTRSATTIARAIADCQGPVLQTLQGLFSASSTVTVISDNGSAAVLTVSNPGRTYTVGITYLDNDASGSLSCGDTVTSVGETANGHIIVAY